eukprot:9126472-Alexandrium_andersonii.AAC.1
MHGAWKAQRADGSAGRGPDAQRQLCAGAPGSPEQRACKDARRAAAVSYTHLTLPTICSV